MLFLLHPILFLTLTSPFFTPSPYSEIGHNLNFAHSGGKDGKTYTGMVLDIISMQFFNIKSV